MDKNVFKEEENKLYSTLQKIDEECTNIEKILSQSSMKYDIENLAQGLVVKMHLDKLEKLKKIKDVPYFARMDFKERGKSIEKFYIGKNSILDSKTYEPVVVDWRAPIANLYYGGRVVDASYKVLDEKIYGDVFLKRQYIIEDRTLKKYVDVDVTGTDPLLQNALEEKADDRLKNIVATIQSEQNKIIRSPINHPLIVQGVAGSGKTTIALHRIAYLIYNYEDSFKPEEFMIIAPNKFFLNYISNILPDLGVNDVKQCTFEDFAYDVIGKRLKIPDNNEKLVMIVNNKEGSFKNVNSIIEESRFKSSIKFKNTMDKYLKILEQKYIPEQDFYVGDYLIMNYSKIKELFMDSYKMYNYKQRINEVEKSMISEVKKKSEDIIEEIKRKRSRAIEGLQGKERIKVFDSFEPQIKLFEKEYKKIIKNYLSKVENRNSIELYKDFLENELIQIAKENNYNIEIAKNISRSTLENIKRNEFEFEDLAPIMYIQYKVMGIREKCKIKHVVIDEAQDYGEFQFDVLKTILDSNSMTILGDIAQGIHFYRGIENWKRFMDVEFKNEKVNYTTLEKTYRTTKEIMGVANNVISKLPEYEKEFIVIGHPVINRQNSLY